MTVFAQADNLRRYVNGGLRTVDGWLGGDAVWVLVELSRQQVAAGNTGAIAEIGVHHGQLLILLSLTQPSEGAIVGIDLFADQSQNTDESGSGSVEVLNRNAQAAGLTPARLTLIHANSLDVTPERILAATGNEGVRLFSVDGGHSAQLTLNDLTLAAESIANDGIVILDDAFSPMWPGVMTGLHQFLSRRRGAKLVPFGLVGNKTLLCRPDNADRWRKALEPAGEYFTTRVDYFDRHLVRILMDSPTGENAWRPEAADWWKP